MLEECWHDAEETWREEAELPWPVIMWDRCKLWNCLPYAGGYLEQPHVLMKNLDTVELFVKHKRQKGAFEQELDEVTRTTSARSLRILEAQGVRGI